jgi:hypothetical protein
MPLSTASPLLLTDPGFLFTAPLATAEPTHAAAGSTYDADTWPGAWINLGATREGSAFAAELSIEPITVAELFDPIRQVMTGRGGSLSFALANNTLSNWKRVHNGGTLATVSGTGATLSSSYTPNTGSTDPTRCMLGWESLDHTVRIVIYQAINSGNIEMTMRRGADYASLPCQFQFETPTGTGIPWKAYAAGTARLGT